MLVINSYKIIALLKDLILILFYNVKGLYYQLFHMATLGVDLSINFYLCALDKRYVVCLWLNLGCARHGLVIIAEFILELHTNVPEGPFTKRNCTCSRIMNEPDVQ